MLHIRKASILYISSVRFAIGCPWHRL